MKSRPVAAGFVFGVVLGVAALLVLGALSDYSGSRLSDGAPSDSSDAAAAESAAAEEVPSRLTVIAVGDILLTRSIGTRIAAFGWAPPFALAAPLLRSADITFANLECPASYLGSPYPGKDPGVTFRAAPGALIGVKGAGIDVVSLANNHMNDYGDKALGETLDALDALGIARSGAGRNEAEARRPAVLEVAGRRVAFLAYAEPMWSAKGAAEGPGIALFDQAKAEADIAAAHEAADLVFVSLHWGVEHHGYPRESDRAIARALIDAGANAILGHHPHVLQGAEFYRGAPILYSLGNFIFDMASSKTYESAAAVITFECGKTATLRLLPIRIERKTYTPAPAEGDDATKILSLIRDRSALLGNPSLIRKDGSIELFP